MTCDREDHAHYTRRFGQVLAERDDALAQLLATQHDLARAIQERDDARSTAAEYESILDQLPPAVVYNQYVGVVDVSAAHGGTKP